MTTATLEPTTKTATEPARPGVTAVLLAVTLFAVSFALPVWESNIVAPQYPNGLGVRVYVDRVEGDTFEVNLLNHYVGMRHVEDMATIERSLAIYLLVLAGCAAVFSLTLERPVWRMLFALPLLLFPVGMFVDLLGWLYYSGHALDPTSALSMTVKPFMPKLVGYQKVANFHVWSSLGWGAWLQIAASAVLARSLWKRSER